MTEGFVFPCLCVFVTHPMWIHLFWRLTVSTMGQTATKKKKSKQSIIEHRGVYPAYKRRMLATHPEIISDEIPKVGDLIIVDWMGNVGLVLKKSAWDVHFVECKTLVKKVVALDQVLLL